MKGTSRWHQLYEYAIANAYSEKDALKFADEGVLTEYYEQTDAARKEAKAVISTLAGARAKVADVRKAAEEEGLAPVVALLDFMSPREK